MKLILQCPRYHKDYHLGAVKTSRHSHGPSSSRVDIQPGSADDQAHPGR
ncbi:hypothetical protein HRbin36_02379 [bacterium HR36]|nr:hypothetical protein HRbin36_02379 [bacterium HR36]